MEKDQKLPYYKADPPRSRTRWAPRILLFMLILILMLWYTPPNDKVFRKLTGGGLRNAPLVPLEIHIMSKCPDARDCLKTLILPTMEKASSMVDFTLSFIGRATDDDGVACKHGETECLGNIVELCAAHLYPDPKISLGFTMCLSNKYEKIPMEEFVEDCALEHGVDFNKLNACMSKDDGQFGLNMLRDSFKRSESVNATRSCTVRLDDKLWCVMENGGADCSEAKGGQPKTLVKKIQALYSNDTSHNI